MRTLANSTDSDEMPQNVAFHQGLHYLLQAKNNLMRKKYNFYLEIKAHNPLIYTMDHPKFIVSNQKEESIGAERVNIFSFW